MGLTRPHGPSAHVAGYLATNEHVVLEMKQHWARVLPAITSCTLGLVLVLVAGFSAPASLGVMTNAAWWIWLVLLAHLAWRVIEWWDETFVITNKRLILVHGLFVKKVAMMPLSKVTDMSYNRSPAARLLGYGTFVMESAGQEQALNVIDYVRDPDEKYREICGLIFGSDDDDASPQRASRTARTDDRGAWQEPWHAQQPDEQSATWDEPWRDGRHEGHRWHEWHEGDDTRYTEHVGHTERSAWRDVWEDETGDDARSATDETQPLATSDGWRRRVREDDTDPYGLVTVADPDPHRDPHHPYPHVGDVGEASDDWDDDSAWSVSREHATAPQSIRRDRRPGPHNSWRDDT